MRFLVREPIKKRITVLMSNHSTKHYDGVPPNWKHELCDMGSSHSRCFLALFWAGLTVPEVSGRSSGRSMSALRTSPSISPPVLLYKIERLYQLKSKLIISPKEDLKLQCCLIVGYILPGVLCYQIR